MTDGAIKLYGKHSETELLKETAQVGRLPHGIMLTGEKGTKKKNVVILWAKIFDYKFNLFHLTWHNILDYGGLSVKWR